MKHLIVVFLIMSSVVVAQDAAKGEAIYKSKCVLCHGADGEGKKSQQAPRLAGQFDWYIVSSLEMFKSGERKNPKMMPYLKGLTNQDYKDLASYISGMQ